LALFKRGPFFAGKPVQPVYLKYPNKHCDISWTCGISTPMMFYRSLCQFVNFMEVEYGQVYYPSVNEQNDATLYADNFRDAFSQHMKIPFTKFTFEDLYLVDACLNHELNPEIVKQITVSKFKRQYQVTFQDILDVLDEFKKVQVDGKVPLPAVATLLDSKSKMIRKNPLLFQEYLHLQLKQRKKRE
jgi:hypothetical protein